MTLAATFLGGAKSRLLPPSVPFRFFAVAVVFHVLVWLGLLGSAAEAVNFRGGLGPTLASVHALTLGVLVMSAIGASVQLLPVATRRPLRAVWSIRVTFWLTLSGLVALVASMYGAHVDVLAPAAALIMAGLLLYTWLLGDNLRRAGSLPVAAAYGWAALAAFALVVGLGLLLAVDDRLGLLTAHAKIALAHLILGGFGFMGLLALGFSHILVPMFALAPAPPTRPSFLVLALAIFAILLGSAGAILDAPEALTLAALVGIAAAALHLRLMLQTLRAGMRRRLGLSFILIKAAWLMLLATPIVGLAALYDRAGPNGAALFAFLLLGGWLLTFLLGILQRILPFLASMHAGSGTMPLISEFSGSPLLRVHATCHGLAIVATAIAIAGDLPWLMRLGCLVGLAGALAFTGFAANIMRRIAWAGR